MRAYLAASYGRREELAGYAQQLRERGHEVKARWLDGTHEHDMEKEPEKAHAFALEDLQDVADVDTFIVFSDDENARGGKHAEFGFALALFVLAGKGFLEPVRLVVIGRREHIFHYLKWVEVFPTWEDFLSQATAMESGAE